MPPQFQDFLDQFNISGFVNDSGKPKGISNEDWFKFKFDNANALYQTAYNAYQSELAFNREKQLINEQNAYNTPSNQLARYMQAGLNPSMIYGQVSPGLQSQTASYSPPRAGEFTAQALPGRTEKLNRALSVISTIGNLFKEVTGVASAVEGVKNMNLQNQILETQLPTIGMRNQFESAYYGGRYDYLDFLFKNYSDNGYITQENWDKYFVPALYPEVTRSEGIRAKTDYQNWWNEVISPLYKEWFAGRSNAQGAQGDIQQYNLEMLESMPPAVRPWFGLIIQLLAATKR